MSKIAVIYWSGTGNTESMANSILEGIETVTSEVELFNVSNISPAEALEYDKLVLGCPAMGAEELEEDEFEPFFTELEESLSGHKVALFGSYGWGDGEWMRTWEDRVRATGATFIGGEGLIVNDAPEGPECVEFGITIANA